MGKVTMTCMTTKQKFEVDGPQVVVLANGRFAYKNRCPWEGKNGKELWAWKFCSRTAWEAQKERETPEEEQTEAPEEPEEE